MEIVTAPPPPRAQDIHTRFVKPLTSLLPFTCECVGCLARIRVNHYEDLRWTDRNHWFDPWAVDIGFICPACGYFVVPWGIFELEQPENVLPFAGPLTYGVPHDLRRLVPTVMLKADWDYDAWRGIRTTGLTPCEWLRGFFTGTYPLRDGVTRRRRERWSTG